ncbi:hypothetical protein SAMN04488103_108104 [Gemmobacter aquatilis]|uniref:O-antigen ligase like membrane protein n=1 Tax=Gemmobacter aquatilis TaxID=933059 RepID=A0A1H8JV78_9RHOB|nr:hypothetical protein [Gemmobacter aquatilis]SEN84196.1 hypothetical protein SAMN04488103_108104 [Gemmobacter aquatilis]
MLAIWPVVVIVLFQRLPPDRALIWTILGAYLVLPPVIALNLPVVPDLGKNSIPALMALAMVLFARHEKISFLPDSAVGRALIAVFVLSPFATVLTNGEAVQAGPTQLQGMAIYDSVAAVANQAIAVLPYFLARRYLGTDEAMRNMLRALVAGGLAYSLPMLIELRMSPQMNVWVYGFMQHDFTQTIRFGGYRPMVFLPHGLWLAFFVLMTSVSALLLLREAPVQERGKRLMIWLYLTAMLVLAKSAGPLVYGVGLSLLILLAPRRMQVLVAAVLAVMVITYPLLRGLHLVPLDAILNLAGSASAERADSLQFRIENEEALLAHASLKPWFGWGGYGRNLLYDPVTGEMASVSDGGWIIVLGIYGWLGYIVQFGLLILPLLLLAGQAMRRGVTVAAPVAGVALLLAANLVDLLPNATLIPFTWLMAGAVLGRAEAMARERAGTSRTARSGIPRTRTIL